MSCNDIRVHGASVCVHITAEQIERIKTVQDIEVFVDDRINQASMSLKELIRWKLGLEEHE